jgi:hypothetical protein
MNIKNRSKLGELLKNLNLDNNGIEIGVFKGGFAKVIVDNFGLSNVYLLDAWKEYSQTEYNDKSNAEQKIHDERYQMVVDLFKNQNHVKIIRKDSREGFLDFPDNFFDFIYIDANHEYEHNKIDLNNWYPKLKTGGLFSGHDYLNNKVIGVKKAVDEFCDKLKITPSVTCERRLSKSWFFVKE